MKSIVRHGLRSDFRVLAARKTSYPPELIKAALAHSVGDAVEGACARTDLP